MQVAFKEPNEGFLRARVRSFQGLDNYALSYVQVQHQAAGVRSRHKGESVAAAPAIMTAITPIRMMVDGNYAKVYVNERRVANIPNADLQRSAKIGFFFGGEVGPTKPVYIGNIRIAAGGLPLQDVLAQKGRVALHGLYFDSGSAQLRPESAPTLREIARILDSQPTMRLRIEGHTDNTGSPAVNEQLSTARAAAIANYLVTRAGVAPSRLEHAGLGDTQPVTANTTPEGRQQNRRVEVAVIQ